MAPYTLGKEYHIAMTFHDNGDGSSTVHWQKRDASTGMLEQSGNAVVENWTLSAVTASTAFIVLLPFISASQFLHKALHAYCIYERHHQRQYQGDAVHGHCVWS